MLCKRQTLAATLITVSAATMVACAAPITVRHESAMASLEKPSTSYYVLQHTIGVIEAVDPMVESQIHTSLKMKGYVPVSKESADLLVSYKLLLENEAELLQSLRSGVGQADLVAEAGMNAGAGPVGAAVGAAGAGDAPQQKLMMVILQTRETSEIVWVGWSETEVDRNNFETRTNEAILQILSAVPRPAAAI